MIGAQLDGDEGGHEQRRPRQQGQGEGRGPPVGARHGEPVDEEEEPAGDGDGAGQVVAPLRLAAALADHAARRHRCHQRDGHVDEQGPAPRGQLRQGPAQDETDGGSPAGDGAVDAEGPGALTRLGEGHGEQGQGRGGHHRGQGSLQRTGPEQHGRVLGQPAQGGRGAETEQADDEHAAPAEVVGDPAAEQQQASEGQGVGAHHPLPVGDRDVQGVLGRRQGHDHHRGVEHDHELGHGDDRQ